jgi:hypothetical protein
MKLNFSKFLVTFTALLLLFAGSLIWLNGHKFQYYFNNRVLDTSNISSISPISDLVNGLQVKQAIDLSRVHVSDDRLKSQPICISIWLSRPNRGFGTGAFDVALVTDKGVWSWMVLTDDTEEHFKRYCIQNAPRLEDLLLADSAFLKITVKDEVLPNNGHIVLSPLVLGVPVEINGKIQEGKTLPYRIEVQRPPTILDFMKYFVMLMISTAMALFFVHAFWSAWHDFDTKSPSHQN